MKIAGYTIFLLILFSTLSYATLRLEDFQLSSGIIIVLVVIGLSLSYMFSHSMNLPQLNAWTKTEIRELLVGVVLFIIIVPLFSNNLLGTNTNILGLLIGQPNYQQNANTFLQNMINQYAKPAFTDDLKAAHLINLKAAFSTSLSLSVFILSLNTGNSPYSGYSSFLTFLSQATYGLTNVIFIYSGLEVLLDFFMQIAPKLIFVAFAFRFIPFTRQMGNTLIALLIAAYIIFPFSILFVSYVHTLISPFPQPQIRDFSQLEIGFPKGASFVCSKETGIPIRFMLGFLGEIGFSVPPCVLVALVASIFGAGASAFWLCFDAMTLVYNGLAIGFQIYFGLALVNATYSITDNAEVIFGLVQPFLASVNSLVVVSYIDTILISAITYIGAKSLSAVLGGEYFMPAISKLI